VGDYQADGLVNNSDYNLWRATFGTATFAGVAADGNASSTVDTADYVLWRKAASLPASRQSVTFATAASVSQGVTSSRESNAAPSNKVVVVPLAESTEVTRHSSAIVWQSASLTTDERHNDDALIAWLASRFDRRERSGNLDAVHQRDDTQIGESSPPLLAEFDAAFASLRL
jgi:hypothetical protein